MCNKCNSQCIWYSECNQKQDIEKDNICEYFDSNNDSDEYQWNEMLYHDSIGKDIYDRSEMISWFNINSKLS